MKTSKKKLTAIFSVALIMVMALSSTAYAIKYGQPDEGNNWSYVCWVVTYPGEGPWLYLGSGSLIAPTVVLTAGHVADVGDLVGAFAYVSFAPNPSWPYGVGSDWITVDSWHTHPDYEIGQDPQLKEWISDDVGILILEKKVKRIGSAQLPDAGFVDTILMKQDVDLVGYGVQFQIHGGGPPDWTWYDFPPQRYYAQAELIASEHVMSDGFMRVTSNPGGDTGGTCSGDSGSPILKAGTNIVLGVCSWGTNGNCAGVSYEQRIDIPKILTWIQEFP